MDTLRECCIGADENDSTDMQAVIAHLTAAVNPAALVLVAHGRKANPDVGPSLINDNRGSNYVVGKMDAIVHFSRDSMQVGGRAIEETEVGLEKCEIPGGFFWRLNDRTRAKQVARDLLMENPQESLRAKARKLAELLGKPEATCLSMLHRLSSAVSQGSENE